MEELFITTFTPHLGFKAIIIPIIQQATETTMLHIPSFFFLSILTQEYLFLRARQKQCS